MPGFPSWDVLTSSVRGASHIRGNKPCQDAVNYIHEDVDGTETIVLAISDGHGSPKSFRSDIGSRLAVNLATSVIADFLSANRKLSHARIRDSAHRLLTTELVRVWMSAVETHLKCNPFTEQELASLEHEAGASARESILVGNGLIVYGATLLIVTITPDYTFYLQLGDGDIVLVNSEGATERAIEADPLLIANETTSLCQKDAAKNFRFRFQNTQNGAPKLIFASTDGYANSFSSESDFLKVGADLLVMAKEAGVEEIEKGLDEWLSQASNEGSGDDVTLGIVIQSSDDLASSHSDVMERK